MPIVLKIVRKTEENSSLVRDEPLLAAANSIFPIQKKVAVKKDGEEVPLIHPGECFQMEELNDGGVLDRVEDRNLVYDKEKDEFTYMAIREGVDPVYDEEGDLTFTYSEVNAEYPDNIVDIEEAADKYNISVFGMS